ncbi:hypothetical protein DICVIV_13145 [Dictyocaulus viviparus]|uniref:Uncharacterized protein n=1 Tax=Dictyocaulus viviparus TaxID=29172 RepID=A0A0D8XAU3_DICVI|nr:hypothetical protein DICVIV_13145 [Dictyocaulus viviparus]
MLCYDIHLHFIQVPVKQPKVHESYDIDCIHFISRFVIDFIQNAVDNFIIGHQHLYSIKHLSSHRLIYPSSVTVHESVADFEFLLVEIRKQKGFHVCFLRTNTTIEIQHFFERNVVVALLPDLNGLHYKKVLSNGLCKELIALGRGVGAALHEIGHMFGAFHSVNGIMSQQVNAIGLLNVNAGDLETESQNCFFDNYSLCVFAHSPFFNRILTSEPSPVLFKISDREIHLKCNSGIFLIVIIHSICRTGDIFKKLANRKLNEQSKKLGNTKLTDGKMKMIGGWA